jgi:hypothetical protein
MSERTSHAASPPLKFCAVIPSHNHDRALPSTLALLRQTDLSVIIVDDGSTPPHRANIAQLHAPDQGVEPARGHHGSPGLLDVLSAEW